jgi:hypothetical protein
MFLCTVDEEANPIFNRKTRKREDFIVLWIIHASKPAHPELYQRMDEDVTYETPVGQDVAEKRP